MPTVLKTTGAVFALMMTIVALSPGKSYANETCDNLAQYLWLFQPSTNASADGATENFDGKLRSLRDRRLGAEDRVPYPFPSIPSSVSSTMDRDTLAKVTSLYDRYIILDRAVQDAMKDHSLRGSSVAAQTKLTNEHNALIQDMSRVAKTAKDEVVRFAFRDRACFDAYENYVLNQTIEVQKQLIEAKATLQSHEEIWAHAEAQAQAQANGEAPAVEKVEMPRNPASDSNQH